MTSQMAFILGFNLAVLVCIFNVVVILLAQNGKLMIKPLQEVRDEISVYTKRGGVAKTIQLYERIGYRPNGPIDARNGIIVVPMMKGVR